MSEPRAYTKEEVRKQLLDSIRGLINHWEESAKSGRLDNRPEGRTKAAMNGLAFSILNIFDGTSMSLPSFDLVLRPHEDDKKFNIENGSNWFEDGQVINDDLYLHEIWHD
jgi:hypothetical protein